MPKRSKYNIFGTLHGVYNPSALNSNGELKYRGKQKPVFRSSYEKQCFYLLESNSGIIWWNYESVSIPYISPIDGKRHTYFMDLVFEAIDKETGLPQKFLVEVKPFEQTQPPKRSPRQRASTFATAAKRYAINVAKWNAALDYANKYGYKFTIWTEQGIEQYKARQIV